LNHGGVKRLDRLFEGGAQPGLLELRHLLEQLFAHPAADCRILGEERLGPLVYRLRVATGEGVRSVVAKRLDPGVAQRNQFVAQRWLPALGLGGGGPSLLGVAAESSGRCVWHVYEDFGDRTLATGDPVADDVEAAVGLIAQIHARSAGHAVLPECRLCGGDLGAHFYTSSVLDAITVLESEQLRDLADGWQALLDRMLERMIRLWDQEPARTEEMRELGGPEALLHGDLGPANTLIVRGGDQVRLIDWDHAGVGPVAYDLSTFLSGFQPRDRCWIFELYRRSIAAFDWRLPSPADLNSLFETAEYARLANSVIWRAMAILGDGSEWAWNRLASMEQWFERPTKPILPAK
jgi:hypothetical protein